MKKDYQPMIEIPLLVFFIMCFLSGVGAVALLGKII